MTILQFDNVGLSRLGELVFEERLGQRAFVKKNRRNRHDETQFIRNTLTHKVAAEIMDAEDPALIHSRCISVSSMRMHGL